MELYGPVIAGVTALISVLIGHAITHFIGEDYKRHRDATALAAAFCGELRGHFIGAKAVEPMMAYLRAELGAGRLPVLDMKAMQLSNDPVFEANAGKIGSLGPELAASTAYIYQLISAIRLSLKGLTDTWDTSNEDAKKRRLKALLDTMDATYPQGTECVRLLHEFALTGTLPGWWRVFTRRNLPLLASITSIPPTKTGK
ncbi:hypothetical protein [Achromobacter mucicolens]|uniref:hypothetical protein n=1 Tax=Achromobacter mucicolens TaxID=1389922 RepID=UPI001CBDAA6F|nr:hypothetical protein [Achromobacter mucicolens]UAN04787.1 hypothetical protein K9D24_11905 [Achromobacter mucicolens]